MDDRLEQAVSDSAKHGYERGMMEAVKITRGFRSCLELTEQEVTENVLVGLIADKIESFARKPSLTERFEAHRLRRDAERSGRDE